LTCTLSLGLVTFLGQGPWDNRWAGRSGASGISTSTSIGRLARTGCRRRSGSRRFSTTWSNR